MKNIDYACLGPSGTHSAIALKRFNPKAKFILTQTITEIFELVNSGKVKYGFVPFENVLNGSVIETIDNLLLHRGKIFAVDSYLYNFRNALAVLPQAKMTNNSLDKIKLVYSHQQPLQQCSKFLKGELKKAKQINTDSTVSGIQRLIESNDQFSAVIASEEAIKENGLKMLLEDISNHGDNKTKFLKIVKADIKKNTPKNQGKSNKKRAFSTFISVTPLRDRKGLLYEILEVLSIKNKINLLGIQSRPDIEGTYIFTFELEGGLDQQSVKDALSELNQYASDKTGGTIKVDIIGSYPTLSFSDEYINSVGIIGGNGKMGRWFKQFFENAGAKVYISDKSGKNSIELSELVKKSDIIILSVPISKIADVSSKVTKILEREKLAGKLVVENSSVKNPLNKIERTFPKTNELLGIHTMFSEKINDLRGENILVTKTKFSDAKSQKLINLFYKYGAKITETSIDDHDQHTSVLQGLLHLVVLSIGGISEAKFKSLKDIEAFSTPNFRLFLDMLGRISSQHEDLTKDLQLLNPQNKKIRDEFLKNLSLLSKELDQQKFSQLSTLIGKSKKFLEY